MNMSCVPEGGMHYDWDLTYIIDGVCISPLFVNYFLFFSTPCFLGMTTVEHAIPIPTLYDDVLTLYALSGTGSTPTHIVNYGGVMGEQLVWAIRDVPNDSKFVSHIDYTSTTHHVCLYPGYGALLDMISWRPCPSLPRDRSTVSLSPTIFLTLADHYIKHMPSLIHHIQSQPWFTKVY
jgi:hypothetical protein